MQSLNSERFDFIIVGAGSAGSVMANRLSAGGRYSVLVLEQGRKDSSPMLVMPKGFGAVLAGDTYVSRYPVSREAGGPDKEIWLRGKTLGGSSSVNGMIWLRPQPQRFDTLTKAGGEHWSWAHMQPYFNELDGGGEPGCGIISVTPHRKQYDITRAFVDAAAATGLSTLERLTQLGQEGAGFLRFNIDRNGKRCSAARAFLKPLKQSSRLRVETGVQVKKLLFDGKRATSVLCQRNDEEVAYAASREIILCAGTLESPQILQRSGIGPGLLLRSLNIPIVHVNPNVGANLREHLLLGLGFAVKSASDSENQQYGGFALVRNLLRYAIGRSGPMSQSPCHAAAFICSAEGLAAPDIQIMLSPFSREDNQFSATPGISITGYPMYPKSTGTLAIQSPEPGVAPLIEPHYLSHDDDRQASIAAIRYIRNIAAQSVLASRLLSEMPASAVAQTDSEIVELYRKNGQPGYHASGTCAMGPSDDSSVVDGRTRVHGVSGVRVVDCSIYPEMLCAVTNASIMGVALRAADLILEDQSRDSQ